MEDVRIVLAGFHEAVSNALGHRVMFTNDRLPRSTNLDGSAQGEAGWTVEPTLVKKGASIGSNVTITPGVTIGERALIGAGAVVTRDIPRLRHRYRRARPRGRRCTDRKGRLTPPDRLR